MSHEPLISAVLLCFNQKDYIEQAFRAMLAQDYRGEWEIVIADDCSTDGSYEILQSLVQQAGVNHRIILHRNEHNRGIAGNLQSAVELCRGEWIVKFDGDDIARCDKISTLVRLQQQVPGHLIYTHDCNEIDAAGNPLHGTPLPDSDAVTVHPYRQCRFDISGIYCSYGCNAMYHCSLFHKFAPLPAGKEIADDTMLSLRAYLLGSGLVTVGKRCLLYRRHDRNNCNFASVSPKQKQITLGVRGALVISHMINDILAYQRAGGGGGRGELSYKATDRLLRLLHADQRRLLLYPYVNHDNNLLTKLKWFKQILRCRPSLWALSLPRLMPHFMLARYLTVKDKIKRWLRK